MCKPPATAGHGDLRPTSPSWSYSGVSGHHPADQRHQGDATNTGTTPLVISSCRVAGTDAASSRSPAAPGPAARVGATADDTASVQARRRERSVRSAPPCGSPPTTPATPTSDFGLFGLAHNRPEQGSNEPPLKAVVDTLGVPDQCRLDRSDPRHHPPAPDRATRSALRCSRKAGTGPVTMKPVARYSPDELLPFGWYLPTRAAPAQRVAQGRAGPGADAEPGDRRRRSAGSFDPGCRVVRLLRRLELLRTARATRKTA